MLCLVWMEWKSHRNNDRLPVAVNLLKVKILGIISKTSKTRVKMAIRHKSISQIHVNQLHRNKMFCDAQTADCIQLQSTYVCAGDQYMRAICFNATRQEQ